MGHSTTGAPAPAVAVLPGHRATALATLGGLHRETDRKNQHRAIEQWLDKERRAELIEAGDGHSQDRHGEHGSPHVDPAWLDRRRRRATPR